MDSITIVKDFISKYYITREITNSDEFKEICIQKISLSVFNEVFHKLVELNDGDFVGDILYIGFVLNIFNKNHIENLRKLLGENWHKSHEDIVGLFQTKFHQNTENLGVLLSALKTIPDYLQPEDFKYSYIRKLIYAIGAQPEPWNIESLEALTKSEDEKIRDLAIHQIEKRKKLGRWEFDPKSE